MNVNRQIHCQGEPPNRSVRVSANSVPDRITGELIEDEHRAVVFGGQFGESADVELQVGVFDVLHLADRVRGFDKIA
jgi:hypothetical protein